MSIDFISLSLSQHFGIYLKIGTGLGGTVEGAHSINLKEDHRSTSGGQIGPYISDSLSKMQFDLVNSVPLFKI